MRWLRGIKKRVFKKYDFRIGIDGVYYHADRYNQMLNDALKVKVGDPIYNIYKDRYDKVAKIEAEWEHQWHPEAEGFNNVRVYILTFITDTGYIIYDIWDCKHLETARRINAEENSHVHRNSG